MKKFSEGQIYHVFNKSIANFGIFKDPNNCRRFIETLDYYNCSLLKERFSLAVKKGKYIFGSLLQQKENQLFKVICFCIMPDHYHLLVKMLKENVFSKFINDLENSYTRFFNIKFKRKGPLWQSAFKSVRIKNSEQLLHVTRYIHLNPTTNNLVDKPESWEFSSYKDFIKDDKILNNSIEIAMATTSSYRRFVENRIEYQRKLKLIKKLIFE